MKLYFTQNFSQIMFKSIYMIVILLHLILAFLCELFVNARTRLTFKTFTWFMVISLACWIQSSSFVVIIHYFNLYSANFTPCRIGCQKIKELLVWSTEFRILMLPMDRIVLKKHSVCQSLKTRDFFKLYGPINLIFY